MSFTTCQSPSNGMDPLTVGFAWRQGQREPPLVPANPQGRLETTLGLPVAAGVTALAVLFHRVSIGFPGGIAHSHPPGWISLFVAAVFLGLFLFQVLLWRFRTLPFGRWLHVHSLNGFYVGTYANRALDRLWPKSGAS